MIDPMRPPEVLERAVELTAERAIRDLTHAMELRYAENMKLGPSSFRVTTNENATYGLELRVELFPDVALPIELHGGSCDGTSLTLPPTAQHAPRSIDVFDAPQTKVTYRRTGVNSATGAWVYQPA